MRIKKSHSSNTLTVSQAELTQKLGNLALIVVIFSWHSSMLQLCKSERVALGPTGSPGYVVEHVVVDFLGS